MRRTQPDPVFDWLAYYAEFDPGRLAAVDLATQRWLTYGEFDDRATRLATALRERYGVEHGDRVAFLRRTARTTSRRCSPAGSSGPYSYRSTGA